MVQSQWKTSQTVPSYQYVTEKVSETLSPKQYAEILGFIAPTGATAKSAWEQAVQKSVGPTQKEVVFDAAKTIDSQVFNAAWADAPKH